MKHLNKTLLASTISAVALSSAMSVQAEGFDTFMKDSSVDLNFRYRVESSDVEGTAADTALANTLKSRATFKTGSLSGFSALVEADNTLHITEDFNSTENGNADYDKVVDPETTQLNQAYIQYTGFDSTIKAGNQRILLDNQRHVGGVGFRQDEATFDAVSVTNKSIDGATIFAAAANNRNTIKNENTEEDIILVNTKYAISDDLTATAFYYGIETAAGAARDTFGLSAKGSVSGIGYYAEIATQEVDAGNTTYMHFSGSTKLGSVKATVGYEAFGSDDGAVAFGTPLGTNHKFYGWTDTFLTGAGNNGIQDIYASAVTKVAGVKLVGQFHNYTSSEGSDPLGNEFGFVAAKKFGSYGASLKVSQYLASDFAENPAALNKSDTTKIWLTGTAKF